MNIKIQDLTKVYPDGHKALNGLNLNIEPGMFGLLGPNGAGKTTLMRIMTLLQNPSSGTIFFDDYDILRDRKAIRSPDFVNVSPKNHLQIMGRYVDVVS